LFDYDVVIDWAVKLLMDGYDYKSLISIAILSKPVHKDEIINHVSDALKDLGLSEFHSSNDFKNLALYYSTKIVENTNVRNNLACLYDIFIESNDPIYTVFFSLYHQWNDLEDDYMQKEHPGLNYYYEGADLENIESLVITEAQKWNKINN